MADTSSVRTLPSISVGTNCKLLASENTRVIIQEKVDGSQLTICKVNGVVTFYNKTKKISGTSKPFLNSYLSLVNKPELFEEGYSYHGEAMNSIQPNTLRYEREPKYFWILYEVVRSDNVSLFPEEIEVLIKDTGIEYLKPLYDTFGTEGSDAKAPETRDYVEIAKDLLDQIVDGKIQSYLGGVPEGVVLKALNRMKDGKMVNTRYKFVRSEFTEMNQNRKNKLPTLSDEEIVEAIGSVYNVSARFQKGVQHLQEQNKWKYDSVLKNVPALVHELDLDLLKEAEEDIKTMLFIRFFPKISRAARDGLTDFLNNLKE